MRCHVENAREAVQDVRAEHLDCMIERANIADQIDRVLRPPPRPGKKSIDRHGGFRVGHQTNLVPYLPVVGHQGVDNALYTPVLHRRNRDLGVGSKKNAQVYFPHRLSARNGLFSGTKIKSICHKEPSSGRLVRPAMS